MIYRANLILESGILEGLSNLKRHDNATLIYADRSLKMDIGFEFRLLQVARAIFLFLTFIALQKQCKKSCYN